MVVHSVTFQLSSDPSPHRGWDLGMRLVSYPHVHESMLCGWLTNGVYIILTRALQSTYPVRSLGARPFTRRGRVWPPDYPVRSYNSYVAILTLLHAGVCTCRQLINRLQVTQM